MEQQYKTPEEILEDLKHISPLALPEYLAKCEFYDRSNAFEALEEVNRKFSDKGGIANSLFEVTWTAIANSVGMIFLRKLDEPTYRRMVKSKSMDFAHYVQKAITFTYDEIPPAAKSSALSALQQDLLRRDMNRHPGDGKKDAEGRTEFTPQIDIQNYDGGKNYRDLSNRNIKETDKLDGQERSIQFNERFLQRQSADGKTIRDSNGEILSLSKEAEPNRAKRAEADHIKTLQQIDADSKYFIERYVDLDKIDEHGRTILQQIVNDDVNFQVLPGHKNASKGGAQSNLQYIETCEKVARAADIYKKMETASPTELAALQAEIKGMNLSPNRRKDARKMANKEKLTPQEQAELDKYRLSEKEKAELIDNQKKAENALRNAFLKEGSKTVLIEQIGKLIEVVIGPIGFEVRDSIQNGMTHGLEGYNPFEAFMQRIWRALCYTVSKLGEIFKNLFEDLAKMVATFFLNACKILQKFFGKIFDLALSGISVLIESIKVLLSNSSAIEKGDAILKIIVGFASGILGQFAVDMLLESFGVPDPFSDVVAAVCSGVIGSLVMKLFERLDLFGIKRELRKQRIEELFSLRAKKLQEAAQNFDVVVAEKLKLQRTAMEQIKQTMTAAFKQKDFDVIDSALDDACELFSVQVPYRNALEFMEFIRTNKKIIIA